MALYQQQDSNREDMLLRSLTTSSHVDKTKIQHLEQPNIITGVAAGGKLIIHIRQYCFRKNSQQGNRDDMPKIYVTLQFFEASGRHGHFFEKKTCV